MGWNTMAIHEGYTVGICPCVSCVHATHEAMSPLSIVPPTRPDWPISLVRLSSHLLLCRTTNQWCLLWRSCHRSTRSLRRPPSSTTMPLPSTEGILLETERELLKCWRRYKCSVWDAQLFVTDMSVPLMCRFW